MLNEFVNNGTDQLICNSLLTKSEKLEPVYGPDDFEKNRVVKLSGHPATLDKIEAILAYMDNLGSMGHSTSFTVYVDGDGGFGCSCKDKNSNQLSKKHSKYLESKVDANGDIKSFDFV